MTDVPERTAVYYIRGGAGELLYIGMTNHVAIRWNGHQQVQPWWDELRSLTVDWYDSREEAAAAEKTAIKAEWPKYNKTYLIRSVPKPAPYPRPVPVALRAEPAKPEPPHPLLDGEDPISRDALSWYLGVNVSTLVRWVKRDYGPRFDVAVDGYWPAEVRAWLDECKSEKAAA